MTPHRCAPARKKSRCGATSRRERLPHYGGSSLGYIEWPTFSGRDGWLGVCFSFAIDKCLSTLYIT